MNAMLAIDATLFVSLSAVGEPVAVAAVAVGEDETCLRSGPTVVDACGGDRDTGMPTWVLLLAVLLLLLLALLPSFSSFLS